MLTDGDAYEDVRNEALLFHSRAPPLIGYTLLVVAACPGSMSSLGQLHLACLLTDRAPGPGERVGFAHMVAKLSNADWEELCSLTRRAVVCVSIES